MNQQQDILNQIMAEIALITRRSPETLDPQAPLGDNGIDSLSFVELLLFIRKQWSVDYTLGGLSMQDLASPETLSKKICSMPNTNSAQ